MSSEAHGLGIKAAVKWVETKGLTVSTNYKFLAVSPEGDTRRIRPDVTGLQSGTPKIVVEVGSIGSIYTLLTYIVDMFHWPVNYTDDCEIGDEPHPVNTCFGCLLEKNEKFRVFTTDQVRQVFKENLS